ncbi:hypothetical protein [Curtobacterium sp. ISL-83]|uniref:hypothetical protein n=1 Tax=Curtobacterium sp. ISL-83 TaxID=2819145 RepID=UPI001BEB46F7|nr:hypothetical protein [Curtobacterium sp. ISL-83]MBT2501418.1 hypothetical protein [Curtobacterium sp. ISL-83]
MSHSGTRKPPTPQQNEGEGAFSYPAQIRLTPHAERYLHQLATDLAAGFVEFAQLSPALRELHVFAFEQGRASLQPELDHANAEADRLYAELVRRPPSRDQDSLNASLEALKHRGAEAAAKRAAEIRAQIYSGQETK